MFMIGISWLVSHEVYTDNNITLNKRRSKVQEKNMTSERTLNSDQWKTFSENYPNSFKLKRGILPL